MREDERHRRARRHLELADRRQVLPAQRDRRVEGHHVRSGDRAERAVGEPADPRDGASVVEAQDQLGPHLHTRRDRPRTSRTMSELRPRGGMKSMTRHGAAGGLDARLEDQGVCRDSRG